MAKITEVRGREVLDSRGNPTVEVEVHTDGGHKCRAIVPSGASTGEAEALELRDGDKSRFLGRGVLKAIENVNTIIAPKVKGRDVEDQEGLDRCMIELDGTENKSRLGANAILGVSMAAAHAGAATRQVPLYSYLSGGKACTIPTPMMNVINGGAHADNSLDFQEFMLVPGGLPTFREALRAGVETFHALKAILKSKGWSVNVGDEGGFAPNVRSNEEMLTTLLTAIEKAGYRPAEHISLALDVAASEFFDDGKYVFKKSDGSVHSPAQMIDLYTEIARTYPIVSIEDGMSERDWDGWVALNRKIGGHVQIVGDDLFVTNTTLLKKGIDLKAANSILIKLNQIGTVTETIEAVRMAREAGYTSVISHRSGETEDTTIADLAVGLETGMIKSGSASRTDRVSKYNRLLRIEEELGDRAKFTGYKALARKP